MDDDEPIRANTPSDARAALRMIRETIESQGPPGALISEEAVLARYGPEFAHEAQAICDALAQILQDSTAAQPVLVLTEAGDD